MIMCNIRARDHHASAHGNCRLLILYFVTAFHENFFFLIKENRCILYSGKSTFKIT